MHKANNDPSKGRIEMRNNKISKDEFCCAASPPYKTTKEKAYSMSSEIEGALSI